MSSIIKVDTIQNQSGANIISESSNTITVGASGDTITVPSGATLGGAGTVDLSSATVTLNANMKNTPAFYAYLSADQSITHATVTKAQFNTEIFDTDNCYDNSTNYRFTPTTAGKYALQAGAIFESVDDAKQGVMYFYKNGTNVGLTRMTNAKTGNFIGLTNTIIVDANGTSDYFEVNVYHDHGSNINISGNVGDPRTYFSGYKLII